MFQKEAQSKHSSRLALLMICEGVALCLTISLILLKSRSPVSSQMDLRAGVGGAAAKQGPSATYACASLCVNHVQCEAQHKSLIWFWHRCCTASQAERTPCVSE